MSEEKTRGNKALVKGGGNPYYPPETKGRFVRGPLDWSLDELIEYRKAGGQPMRIPDKDILYNLGAMGVSMENAAKLFDISREKFSSNLDWLENWQKGRSECSARIRARIVEQALEENVLNAMIYLDKLMGGDSIVEQVQVDIRLHRKGRPEAGEQKSHREPHKMRGDGFAGALQVADLGNHRQGPRGGRQDP